MKKIIEEIKKLKNQKNAIVLAHSYQNIEIDEVADFVGDSLYLSQQAKKTNADIIIFAGVYFMAQTAKIISPNKKVLLPNINAGCLMADMINYKQMRDFKSKYPNIPIVCYINSTAEVKAECDICCTSSNALQIVKSLNSDRVLFLPDQNLGKWVENQLSNVQVITYEGNCPVHHNIKVSDIEEIRNRYPNAKILIHPECKPEVSKLGDYVGSTSGIINYVKNSSDNQFIIVTEKGVYDRLKRDYPDKEFILIKDNLLCESMKLTTLEEILNALYLDSETFYFKLFRQRNNRNCIGRKNKTSKCKLH